MFIYVENLCSPYIQFKGALVVSPIATPRHQVVGTVNVDSLSNYLDDPNINFDFENHEINFYQVLLLVVIFFSPISIQYIIISWSINIVHFCKIE